MTPAPTPPMPGSMTVPPLFGWQEIVLVLGLLLVVAVAFFVASAAGRSSSGRSEFQAMLAARSGRFEEPAEAPRNGEDDVPGRPGTSP